MPVQLSYNSPLAEYKFSNSTLRGTVCQLLAKYNLEDHAVSVVLMDDAGITGFNEQYRHRQGATNVLSFPFSEAEESNQLPVQELGDILISVETAAREAEKERKTIQTRLIELIIHGFLHLLGHDHERSEAEAWEMWDLEKQLFKKIIKIKTITPPRSTTMTHLAINVDHVATIREARGTLEPDPVFAAGVCELAGASGIVVHLREDRRHIQDRDVKLLRETVKTKLNLEMATSKEIIKIALKLKPDMVTLVPEKRQELTTEGGLDIISNEKKIRKTIKKMAAAGIPVSLFIDPDAEQIEAAVDVGATFVELHTGRYCDAPVEKERDREFLLIERSAELAYDSGLRVNAGHGLDYFNTARVARLETIEELSIGHAVMARAIFVGLDQAVREMMDVILTA